MAHTAPTNIENDITATPTFLLQSNLPAPPCLCRYAIIADAPDRYASIPANATITRLPGYSLPMGPDMFNLQPCTKTEDSRRTPVQQVPHGLQHTDRSTLLRKQLRLAIPQVGPR